MTYDPKTKISQTKEKLREFAADIQRLETYRAEFAQERADAYMEHIRQDFKSKWPKSSMELSFDLTWDDEYPIPVFELSVDDLHFQGTGSSNIYDEEGEDVPELAFMSMHIDAIYEITNNLSFYCPPTIKAP